MNIGGFSAAPFVIQRIDDKRRAQNKKLPRKRELLNFTAYCRAEKFASESV